MLFSRDSCLQSTFWALTAGFDFTVSKSKSIYSSIVVSSKICANNSWNSVLISSFTTEAFPTSKPHFFEAVLNDFWDYTLPCGLEAGDCFQYVYFLDYLRSCFSFINPTYYVTNKQFSVFMLKVPGYTGVKRF